MELQENWGGQYFGVNGVARKIKNGYIGIAGVARQFYGGLDMTYSLDTVSDGEAPFSSYSTVTVSNGTMTILTFGHKQTFNTNTEFKITGLDDYIGQTLTITVKFSKDNVGEGVFGCNVGTKDGYGNSTYTLTGTLNNNYIYIKNNLVNDDWTIKISNNVPSYVWGSNSYKCTMTITTLTLGSINLLTELEGVSLRDDHNES